MEFVYLNINLFILYVNVCYVCYHINILHGTLAREPLYDPPYDLNLYQINYWKRRLICLIGLHDPRYVSDARLTYLTNILV